VSWPLAAGIAAVCAVVLVNAPVLGHYFFGDDFVPLAEVESRSTWGYLRDLFLMRDVTPNWRFLSGIYYLVMYRMAGLDATPYFAGALALHAATAALLFRFVWRATGDAWTALLASALFGVTAAHSPTAAQVTAFNNVLAAFFLVLALVLLHEGLERGRTRGSGRVDDTGRTHGSAPTGMWIAGSAVAFAAAIASNESSAVSAPAFAAMFAWRHPRGEGWWRSERGWRELALAGTPYALLGATALIGFGACECTEGDQLYGTGDHLLNNVWVYLGRLLYPIGMGAPHDPGTAHVVAGAVTLLLALAMLVRGPGLARVSVLLLGLAILPYVPIDATWSAARYVYLASIPFAVLAALLFRDAGRTLARFAPQAPLAVALLAVSAVGLLSWQTWEQNQAFGEMTEDWRAMIDETEGVYAPGELGPDAMVYARGGPVTDYYFQCAVLPAVGQIQWGDAKLFTFLNGDLERYRVLPGHNVYALDYQAGRTRGSAPTAGGRFERIALRGAGADDPPGTQLLPHVDPKATGNLCLAPALEGR
jgi:hypothetical protein